MRAVDKYNKRVKKINSLVCVGLDSEFSKLPAKFKKSRTPQFDFNKWIIKETHKYTAAYKPNIAFYEARGDKGVKELKLTMMYLKENHPEIFTICDCKRADIGNTNNGYVESLFDWYGFDAVTLHPYLGGEALKPFLERKDKVSIVLCRTSNPGVREIQDLRIDNKPLWQAVVERVKKEWNKNGNCMLVVGATYPNEIKKIRKVTGDMTLLVPGVGVQGGNVKEVLRAGLNSQGRGLIINSARGIIFSNNPSEEAIKLRNEINLYRK